MRILIVDDEPVIRRGLVKMVNKKRFSITDIRTASNGREALRLMEELEPDFVFTDIRMPKMDGLELCKYIHEQYKHVLTVVISGYDDFAYAQKCVTYGVKHYLLKPITPVDIDEILENLVKSYSKEFVRVSKYLAWIEQAECCIWNLQADGLEKLVSYWADIVYASQLNAMQLYDLIKDCLEILNEKLQAKGFETADAVRDWDQQIRSKDEVVQFVSRYLHFLYDQLSRQRLGSYKDPMEEIKEYIDTHLSEEITLEEVAKLAGFTPTYFSSMFKRVTNETFVQYRINRRMSKAKELLAVPHIRIVDIAAEVGYGDYPHFSKMFKKTMGYTPSEYRQRLGIH